MTLVWTLLPWVISAVTMTAMWLAGSKSVHAWTLGLGNQVLWFAWIVHTESWGLLVLTGGMVCIYTRNLRRWRAERPDGD